LLNGTVCLCLPRDSQNKLKAIDFIYCGSDQIIVTFKLLLGYSFKHLVKVGIEESIVNAPLGSLMNKNVKSEVRLKQQNCDPQSVVRSQLTLQRQP
jgi:hypothetical protein